MSGSHASLGGGAIPKSAGRYLDASPGSSSEDERFREDITYSSSSVVFLITTHYDTPAPEQDKTVALAAR